MMTSDAPLIPDPTGTSKKPKNAVRDALIRCGVELCTESGFQVTGIESILRQVGVPKGSFYHYFKNKHEFGLAVIDSYADYFGEKLRRLLDDETVPPLQRLRNFVHDAQRGMERYDFRRGCLVGNLGQELAGLDDEFRERLESVLRSWEQQTADCLNEAQANGELEPGTDVQALAAFFWIGWEGAILRSKLTRSHAPMTLFSELFFDRIMR